MLHSCIRTPVMSARCSEEIGRIAEGSSALIRGTAIEILYNVRRNAAADSKTEALRIQGAWAVN